MEHLAQQLWFVSIGLFAVLAARLVWTRLHGRYKAFFFWLCLVVARNSALELLGEYTERNFWFWLYTEPVLVLGFVVVVFEIYNLALQSYGGIQTASKRILTFALIVASTISVLSIFPDLQYGTDEGNVYFLFVNVIRRGIYTSLLVFLILLVSFISVFPIKLNRNTVVHVVLFSTVFLMYTATILALNLQGLDIVDTINVSAALVTNVCILGWIVLLSPAGESVQTTIRSRMSAADADVLLKKLKDVNDSLGSSRKHL